ncbi:MAG: hypothetical protein ACW975_02395 [Candidatus Thorarchaeota archaeon]
MSKDTTSNVLYVLGVIGSILIVIIAAYYLAAQFIVLPEYSYFTEWVVHIGLILLALAFLGIYRDIDSSVPILAMISFLTAAIISALALLNMFGSFFLSQPDPVAVELALLWALQIIYLIAFILAGLSVWKTQEQIGGSAKVIAIIFMIWGFIRLVLRFLDYGLGPTIYDQLMFAGPIIVYLVAGIYFILMIRR